MILRVAGSNGWLVQHLGSKVRFRMRFQDFGMSIELDINSSIDKFRFPVVLTWVYCV